MKLCARLSLSKALAGLDGDVEGGLSMFMAGCAGTLPMPAITELEAHEGELSACMMQACTLVYHALSALYPA